MYQQTNMPQVRMLPVIRYPYLVFYTIDEALQGKWWFYVLDIVREIRIPSWYKGFRGQYQATAQVVPTHRLAASGRSV